MHETAFATSLLRIVLEEVKKYEKSGQLLQVTYVRLRTGLLDCMEACTLQGCFTILAENTAAAGAVLEVVVDPMHGRCRACGEPVQTEKRRFVCPLCGQDAVDWQGGRAIYIDTIKVIPAREE